MSIPAPFDKLAARMRERTALVFQYRTKKPLGRMLAEGRNMSDARELCNASNWRLRAAIAGLRAARAEAELVKDDLRIGQAQRHVRVRRKALAARNLARWTYNVHELLKQRARLRRNRGRQLEMTFERTEPRALVAASSSSSTENPRHSSDSFEHGSPPPIVEAARLTMGGIDLDPASSEKANGYVKAAEFFTQEDNGFLLPWHGRVFLNPPGGLMELDTGRPVFIKTKKRESCTVTGACGLPPGHKHVNVGSSARAWWRKLATEWLVGRVTQAVFVGFSLEILQTTQADGGGLVPLDLPLCYPRERLDYIALDKEGIVPGGAPTHASFVAYLPGVRAFRPATHANFVRAFEPFGRVVG